MKKILFVGAEAMPFAATGGLGDVLGSLPAAIKAAGKKNVDVRVIMPLYSVITQDWRSKMREEAVFEVQLSWRRKYCGIFSLEKEGVVYYFVDNEYYFKRRGLYGEYDDGERYAFFCMAVMEFLCRSEWKPDILHAHDWQAALSIVYLNRKYRLVKGFYDIKTVFTIHNIEYQGKYDFAILGDVFGLSAEDHGIMEYGDCINLMKAAIECADRVTTVSPRYAEEILGDEYSHGLSSILNKYSFKLSGILNGIDYNYYNPHKDEVLVQNYTKASAIGGKADCKLDLQRTLGLPQRTDAPLVAIVSRLAAHKGIDLVAGISQKMLSGDLQFVVLGRGEQRFENFFVGLEHRYPDRMRAIIDYDRELSRRIYAAADIFVMPSKSEPCGLSQMIASRYGAIPVVRETGGLYDSIKGYWEHDDIIEGNGFTFANYSEDELIDRIWAAMTVWHDMPRRKKLISRIMSEDFSWNSSAKKYLELYAGL